MSIAYHGNYCGPGWSAGAYQKSVVSDVSAVDAFDQTCKEHDAAYALGEDLLEADWKFARANLTSANPKAMLAGLAVGAQGLGRAAYRVAFGSHDIQDEEDTTVDKRRFCTIDQVPMTRKNKVAPLSPPLSKKQEKNLRKVIAETKLLNDIAIKPNLRQKSRYMGLKPSIKIAEAPVSIGTTVTASKPITKTTPTGVLVRGREFLCSVFESINPSFQLGALAPIHPAFYPASTMGTMARAFQKYKFRRLAIHFITRQPTSATGQIALVYSSQINEPAEDGTKATFLPRVMTRGKASLGPVWQNHTIEIDCDSTFRLIDPFSQAEIATHVFGEVQCYTLAGVADTAGYLLIDYELEFHTTMFAPHSTVLPLPTGAGSQYTLVDFANPVVSDAVLLVLPSTMNQVTNGTIWRCILNADESTLATGTTLANAWNTNIRYLSNTTTDIGSLSAWTLTDGMQFYIVVIGSNGYVYLTLESAITGDGTGQAFYRTAGTSKANWLVNCYVVQQPPVIQAVTQ